MHLLFWSAVLLACCRAARGGHYCSYGQRYTAYSCAACSTGFYQNHASHRDTSCKTCAEGKEPNTAKSACVGCPTGQVSNADTNFVCVACGAGTQLNSGKTACESCAAGTVSATGVVCVSCNPGANQYQDQTGQAVCKTTKTCGAGRRVGVAATSSSDLVCWQCAKGTAQSKTSHRVGPSCPACPFQQVAPTTGRSSCTACINDVTYFIRADVICQTCSECGPGLTQSVACAGAQDRICTDQTAPVITVKRFNNDGEGSLQKLSNGNYLYTVPHASTYVALGATAEDEVDAADPAVSTSGGSLAFLNTGVVAMTVLTLTSTDASSNTASLTVTIDVVDQGPPVITPTQDPLYAEATKPLDLSSVFAVDAVDGDLSAYIVSDAPADITATLGTKSVELSLSQTDSAGNAAVPVTLTVIVRDTVGPVITLAGGTKVTHEGATPWEEPGVTAVDAFSGPTENIVISGLDKLNVDAPAGTIFSLAYKATDANDASSFLIRKITIADTTNPTISLSGDASLVIQVGSTYADAGAVASDTLDPNPTITTTNLPAQRPPSLPFTYTVRLTARDLSGNEVSVTRTVKVVDTTPPNIEFAAADSMISVEAAGNLQALLPNPFLSDNYDAQSAIVVENNSSAVDLLPAGPLPAISTVTFDAIDTSENGAAASITVSIDDTTPPSLERNGPALLNHQGGMVYIDPGQIVTDNLDTPLMRNLSVVTNATLRTAGVRAPPPVCSFSSALDFTPVPPQVALPGGDSPPTDRVGQYAAAGTVYDLLYEVADRRGNSATASRTVTIVDESAPTVTVIGTERVSLEYAPTSSGAVLTYSDPGARAMDNLDGDLSRYTCVVVNMYSPSNPGVSPSDPFAVVAAQMNPSSNRLSLIRRDADVGTLYMITYIATDGAGLSGTATRYVAIVDTTPPVVALNGPATQRVPFGTAYREQSFTATDLNDTPPQLTLTTAFDTAPDARAPGTYTVTYSATDRNGNTATIDRIITVLPRPTETEVPASARVRVILEQPLQTTLQNLAQLEAALVAALPDSFPVIIHAYDPDNSSTRHTDNLGGGSSSGTGNGEGGRRRNAAGTRSALLVAAYSNTTSAQFPWLSAGAVVGDLSVMELNGTPLMSVNTAESESKGVTLIGIIAGCVGLVALIVLLVVWRRYGHSRNTKSNRVRLTSPLESGKSSVSMHHNPLFVPQGGSTHTREGITGVSLQPDFAESYAMLEGPHRVYAAASAGQDATSTYAAVGARQRVLQVPPAMYTALTANHKVYAQGQSEVLSTAVAATGHRAVRSTGHRHRSAAAESQDVSQGRPGQQHAMPGTYAAVESRKHQAGMYAALDGSQQVYSTGRQQQRVAVPRATLPVSASTGSRSPTVLLSGDYAYAVSQTNQSSQHYRVPTRVGARAGSRNAVLSLNGRGGQKRGRGGRAIASDTTDTDDGTLA